MAYVACEMGLRPRLLEEYFSLLQNAGRIMENPRMLGNEMQKFRNCEAIQEYLAKHPELK